MQVHLQYSMLSLFSPHHQPQKFLCHRATSSRQGDLEAHQHPPFGHPAAGRISRFGAEARVAPSAAAPAPESMESRLTFSAVPALARELQITVSDIMMINKFYEISNQIIKQLSNLIASPMVVLPFASYPDGVGHCKPDPKNFTIMCHD